MSSYLYHRTTGRVYEIIATDKVAKTITLKNDLATFTDTYDKDKLKARGYIAIREADDEADAKEQGAAKVAEEAEAEEAA